MAPKEPTRQQLSSKLSYSQHTPAFLQRLQNRIAGVPDEDEQEDPEWEDDGSGRPPIPRRPAIPERPADDPGSADEDNADEKPQVVVLRKGKHLTEREAENIRRSERGLPPLPEPEPEPIKNDTPSEHKSGKPGKASTPGTKPPATSLSFSSSKTGQRASGSKRKVVVDVDEGDDEGVARKAPKKKKVKKDSKTLLSFGDDA